MQFASDTHYWKDADFEVKVGGSVAGGNTEEIVDFYGHNKEGPFNFLFRLAWEFYAGRSVLD
jgi:hypothetical protein